MRCPIRLVFCSKPVCRISPLPRHGGRRKVPTFERICQEDRGPSRAKSPRKKSHMPAVGVSKSMSQAEMLTLLRVQGGSAARGDVRVHLAKGCASMGTHDGHVS